MTESITQETRSLVEGDHLVSVLEALGTHDLAGAILGWLNESAQVDEFFAFERPTDFDAHPSSVLALGAHPQIAERVEAYCSHFHRFDPINHLLTAQDPDAQAIRISPGQISDRNYRLVCYERPHFVEKVSLWCNEGSHWVVASFFRTADAGVFTDANLDAISRCGRLVFPIIRKHRLLQSIGATGTSTEVLIKRLQRRLEALPVKLTSRQLDVCARTAVGMTAYGIALDLGIKTSSVVTYRRRAYDRLGIATGHELSRLLLI